MKYYDVFFKFSSIISLTIAFSEARKQVRALSFQKAPDFYDRVSNEELSLVIKNVLCGTSVVL